jgi:hypothetical protein
VAKVIQKRKKDVHSIKIYAPLMWISSNKRKKTKNCQIKQTLNPKINKRGGTKALPR